MYAVLLEIPSPPLDPTLVTSPENAVNFLKHSYKAGSCGFALPIYSGKLVESYNLLPVPK